MKKVKGEKLMIKKDIVRRWLLLLMPLIMILMQGLYRNVQCGIALVVADDTINDEARYIYLSVIDGDDFTVEKIEKEFEYNRIAQAYLHMED